MRYGRIAFCLLAATAVSAGPAASPYVPLDSWVYPALDRLAAWGLVPSQLAGLRPWTRAECRRQLAEADTLAAESGKYALGLLRALHSEFDGDRPGLALDSLYVRAGGIAGPALDDSFHLGQTWTNDQGRPFGRGVDGYMGADLSGAAGRFFGAARVEYQRAPGMAAYPLAVRQTIADLDGVPVPAGGVAAVSRLRAVEAYAGVRLGNVQVSAGKQSLWWGPGYDAPLSFSSNAEPTQNVKLSTVSPIRLGKIGVRAEFVLGKLGGPWFNAQKVSFQLTRNLEMGFTRWSIFWGAGHPATIGSFLRNFSSFDSPAGPGRSDPGDRKAGFDFRYRVPGLRDRLTLYTDSYSDDDPSPLAAPRRAAIAPGIFLARFPGLPRLDLRIEAPSTQPMGWDMGGRFLYFNTQYRAGNTNHGRLLGNPAGRDGRAVQTWLRWWLGSRGRIEASYRQAKISGKFLPGGATQSDAAVRAVFDLAPSWRLSVMSQYERFFVPLVGGPRRGVSGWVQLAWTPALKLLP